MGVEFALTFMPSFCFPLLTCVTDADKRVVVGSDKPSEGVATSLRFLSQPGSFSPGSFGNKPSDYSCKDQEKNEVANSAYGCEHQDSSPIKTSPVSERIKALEALAAKQNEGNGRNDGFSHFRDRHHEKSPTEATVPVSSTFQKKTAPPDQDSPESPFEVLGDARQVSDDEDTVDWMRAHLPPAPDFGTEEAEVEDEKDIPVSNVETKEVAPKDIVAMDVSGSFVGVPDDFMDNPTAKSPEPEKEESIEEESEFDLSFLPTAYMWEKQDKTDKDTRPPEVQGSDGTDVLASAPPPAGFGSPSPPLSPPPSPSSSPPPSPKVSQPQAPISKGEPTGGESEPTEILEVDSSGESDDTVIEDAASISASIEPNKSLPCGEKETSPSKPEKQFMLVPIINVIETEEQVVSDEEMEQDYEEYKVVKDPVRETLNDPEPVPGTKVSDVTPAEDPKPTDEYSPQPSANNSAGSSPKHYAKEDDDIGSVTQTTALSKGPISEEIQVQPPIPEQPPSKTFNSAFDKTVEESFDLSDHQDDDLSDDEPIDPYMNSFPPQAQKETTKSDLTAEEDLLPKEFPKTNFFSDMRMDSLVDNTHEDDFDNDSLPVLDDYSYEKQLNFPTVPETSLSHLVQDDANQTLVLQNNVTQMTNSLLHEEDEVSGPEAPAEPPKDSDSRRDAISPHANKQADTSSKLKDQEACPSLMDGGSELHQGSSGATKWDLGERPPSPEPMSDPESVEPECSVSTATDSFVEFMRECLKSRQDEEPDSSGPNNAGEAGSASRSSPAMVMDLEQEHLTIRALRELGSSQEDDEDLPLSTKTPKSPLSMANPVSETSLSPEVEAFDVWVAEAYHLAEHVLAAVLTHLSAKELVYWRDPKKSGVVFGVSMLLLLSLATFSVISVASYVLLALLCVTISFRIYKSVIQAVQKSNEGHPFKALMEKDVSVPPETFRKHVDVCLTYINRGLKYMSRLFLVEDLVDSLKLAVVMWLLTYVGAVFNGITILILADILLFTVPLGYEKNKTQIDHYIDIARTQINTTVAKLQEKLPGSLKRKAE
uniref:Reticulon n=1 Tax=Denticeps clupeoides TaxID=299321 RepID=A0AAY4A3M1_9TELE